MELILVIVVLLLLFGGGGFYGYRGGTFAGPLPGIIGLIIMIALIFFVIRLLGGATP